MRLSPITLYRPTRTPDGAGGFTEAYADGATVFGRVRVHQAKTELVVRWGTDVVAEDVVVISAVQYRVAVSVGTVGAPFVSVPIERIAKPIAGLGG